MAGLIYYAAIITLPSANHLQWLCVVVFLCYSAEYPVLCTFLSEINSAVNIIICQEYESSQIQAMFRQIITKVSYRQFLQLHSKLLIFKNVA